MNIVTKLVDYAWSRKSREFKTLMLEKAKALETEKEIERLRAALLGKRDENEAP